mmetsp:Transcript_148659/g.277018  ORF Transcript_148659/g.277018 Transcript_148659/m.277018 type:complete len:500 (+) Transcript_148659:111-1610(+)
MTSYECCFSSGRQFVFAESTRWTFDAVWWLLVVVGLGIGLFFGVTISIGGVRQLELLLLALAVTITLKSYYYCFRRSLSSVDLSQFTLLCLLIGIIYSLLLAVVRYSFLLDIDFTTRCTLWSIGGLVLGLGVRAYQQLCCQEDERKHHLRVVSPCQDGDTLAGKDINAISTWEALMRFLFWIFSWQWYALHDSGAQECTPSESITVHNRTLKLIKVCFYASDDMCCWVPFGGVAGRCVGFIPAEQSHTFKPPRHYSESGGGLRLKVFQPGLFDKELACFSQAKAGQSFAFHDVEGMVRRSRVLSSPQPSSLQKRPLDDERRPSWQSMESSESEYEPPRPELRDTGMGKADDAPECGLMRRNRSAGDLQWHKASPLNALGISDTVSPQQAEERAVSSRGDSPVTRRAAPNEVVIRNRSNQEIRALLFRLDDYCYVVPLVGHVIACGDHILPDNERRFNPRKDTSDEFTLKVYSVGPGAKELTYVTVRRGHTYTFCDSLLS